MTCPCASKKCLTHKTRCIASFAPITSASVDLLVFIFCFVLKFIGHPLPIDIVVHVWLRTLGFTACDECVHQRITLMPPASRVSLSSFVSRRNRRNLPSFFQSSPSGSYTLVHKNDIASSRHGLVRFPRYRSCATM